MPCTRAWAGFHDVVSTLTYVVPTPVERGGLWLVPRSDRLGLLAHEESGERLGCIPTEACDFPDAVPGIPRTRCSSST